MKKIYINVLLKDNMIMCWHISSNNRTRPSDYYKDFIYADYDAHNCDNEFIVKGICIEFDEENDEEYDLNNYIFEEIAKTFFKKWKIHPNHFGRVPYDI